LSLHESVAGDESGASACCAAAHRMGNQASNRLASRSSQEGASDYVFAFHDRDEIGPRMLTRIAKHTGLRKEDL
jgi:hypothetical protein